MWDAVGVIAAVVVIVLLLQLLDVSEVLKAKLKGETTGPSLEQRVAELERRLEAVEKRGF
jgi:hypothetical protein